MNQGIITAPPQDCTDPQDYAIERADAILASVGLPLYGDVSGALTRIIGLIERPSDELGHHVALLNAISEAKALYAAAPTGAPA
jgi:hypothetical protein